MIKKKRVKAFQGVDWRELSERWGIDFKNDLTDDECLNETASYIIQSVPYKDKRQKKVARDIRSFLKKLIKWDNTYKTPVWEGLLKVENDETLLTFTYHLLQDMWD